MLSPPRRHGGETDIVAIGNSHAGKTSAEMVLRPAAGAIFALVDGRSVLFSETRQKLYELDQLGAFIWCKLAQCASLEDVHQELVQLGIGERAAREFTWQAMNVWIDRGCSISIGECRPIVPSQRFLLSAGSASGLQIGSSRNS